MSCALHCTSARPLNTRCCAAPRVPLQVENCLTTKAVSSEQYIEEVKAMKACMLQQCPHLARWGLGSNKVRYSALRYNTTLLLLLLLGQLT